MSNAKRKSEEDRPRILSCQRCRERKIKCSLTIPCSNCIKTKSECRPVTADLRKKRHTSQYVTSLEKQVVNLQKAVTTMKGCKDSDKRDALLDSIKIETIVEDGGDLDSPPESGSNVSGGGPEEVLVKSDVSPKLPPKSNIRFPSVVVESSQSNSISVYGPTSVYDNNLMSESQVIRPYYLEINKLNKDPEVIKCIQLFFKWQYPDHNMFIYRESFLIDFFNPKPNSLYCSEELILAICALGSRMSIDDQTFQKSRIFYQRAKSKLLSKLDYPCISSLQSFLLLAFYDICNGSNASGWMLSGIAMRMGFDLGFQLNPENWFLKSTKSEESLSPLNISIRSRIYWGCYMADHFISLLLGRPSLLKLSDATIPESKDLPDLEWISEFSYVDPLTNSTAIYISSPLTCMVNLINISDNMLHEIFSRGKNDSEDLDIMSRYKKIREYNLEIIKWRDELPPSLRWDVDDLKQHSDNPTLTSIRYYYYILLLCLNRPFVSINPKRGHKDSDNDLAPSSIINTALEDLTLAITCFRVKHGLSKASIFIVYCSILSLSVILLTNNSRQLLKSKKYKLEFFLTVLKECSKTWELARKSHDLIKKKMRASRKKEESNNGQSLTVTTNNVNYNTNGSNFSPTSDQSSTTTSPLTNHLPANSSLSSSISQTHQSTNHGQATIRSIVQEPMNSNSHHMVPVQQQSSIRDDMSQQLYKTASNSSNSTGTMNNFDLMGDESIDFLGGPPVLMTSDLFNEDWESLFPDYIFNTKS